MQGASGAAAAVCAAFRSFAGTRDRLRRGDARLEVSQQRGGSAERGFAAAARRGLPVGSRACGFLRLLAGFDGARECQAIVALVDGGVRFLERGSGRRERVVRVLFGPGRTRRVNGALRAIEFFLGRF